VSCQSRNVISTAGRNLRFLSRENSFEMTEYRWHNTGCAVTGRNWSDYC